jgi:flavin reductase (DIM6/NTAB) family NADH-FMN oxidoreductase RutF
VIDRDVKRCLGQMIKGIEVIGAAAGGVQRAFTTHWVSQVSFEEPIVMASVSPKHDTYPLMVAAGEFAVSILAADQIVAAQYFSYPGHRMHHVATELLAPWPGDADGPPIVPDSVAHLRCATFERTRVADHELFLARVVDVAPGRLREPPLLYSSRLGWRATGDKAREPGAGIRDRLLARAGVTDVPDDGS